MDTQNWQKGTQNFSKIKQGSPSLALTEGLKRRIEIVQKYVDFRNKKILDIGCGVGVFLKEFEKYTKKENIFGIEVDEEKVEIAKKSGFNVIQSPAENMPFKDNFFDILWCHEVIEHVDDDKKTVEECVRVLKNQGKFILFAPNRLFPFETHGIYIGDKYFFGNIPLVNYLPKKIYKSLTPHVRNYSNRDIENLFTDLPVKIILHSHIFPGFSKKGKIFQKIIYPLEKTPLNYFGISHFLILEKI